MDRAQRVNEKNGVICLFIMFTHRVTVIKMSKMGHFLYFLLITAKKMLQSLFSSYMQLTLSPKFRQI